MTVLEILEKGPGNFPAYPSTYKSASLYSWYAPWVDWRSAAGEIPFYHRVGRDAVSNSTKWGSGFSFGPVDIPAGKVITSAYLIVKSVNNDSSQAVRTRITGAVASVQEWLDNADFVAKRGIVLGGANNSYLTPHQVNWDNIESFTAGDWFNSPDIKAIIQDIINGVGWASGNTIFLYWDDFDDRTEVKDYIRRTVYSSDTYWTGTNGIKLHIEYITPPTSPKMKGDIHIDQLMFRHAERMPV
jgi:hypothetical protein